MCASLRRAGPGFASCKRTAETIPTHRFILESQRTPALMDGKVGEVVRGASGRTAGASGNEYEEPGVQGMLFALYLDDPRSGDAYDEHVYLVVYVFPYALSGVKPYQVGVQVGARGQGPDHP